MRGAGGPAGDPDAAAYATATGLALQSDGAGMSRISLIPLSRTERKVAARAFALVIC